MSQFCGGWIMLHTLFMFGLRGIWVVGTRRKFLYGPHICESRVKSTVLIPRMPAARGIREDGTVIPKFSNR
jgi:hypothetical protein